MMIPFDGVNISFKSFVEWIYSKLIRMDVNNKEKISCAVVGLLKIA
jgi:hypothetical protein